MLRRRIGFEIELMAPPGSDRAALAAEIVRREAGTVRRVLHTDSEPSLVPGMGTFLHLTPGFEVRDARGQVLATLVDDITLSVAAQPVSSGWIRLLTDELRLLRLVEVQVDPGATAEDVLKPVAEVFGTEVEHFDPRRPDRPAQGDAGAFRLIVMVNGNHRCDISPTFFAGDQLRTVALPTIA